MSESLFMQVVYASAAVKKFDQQQLKDLLVKARKNNHALGLTGLLLYEAGSFLQVLEGPTEAVTTMFGRIEKDPRHDRVMMLLKRHVDERTFAEWDYWKPATACSGRPRASVISFRGAPLP